MATTQTLSNEKIRQVGYAADSWRFDLVTAIAALGFIFGLYLDGWAHSHGKVDTSFFTPWHGVLYSTFGIVGVILVGTHFYNITRGYAWAKALPRGYLAGLVGVMIFALGGVGDMFWHQAFGIENGIEALYSPSHLTLAIGGFLFVSSPFLAAWGRRKRISGWREFLPIFLSALAMVSMMTFFTELAYFGSSPMFALVGFRSQSGATSQLGVTSALIMTAIYSSLMLIMLKRWRLPFGIFTLLFAINNALMVWLTVSKNIEYTWTLAFALSGLVVDILLLWLKPSSENTLPIRVLAGLFPFVLTLSSLGVVDWIGKIQVHYGLWWEIHMWLGVPVLSALTGLLISFLVFPPTIPNETEV